MTPRPQFLPASARHTYLTMPGSIVNYCGHPAAVLAPYYLLRERVDGERIELAPALPVPEFAATRAATFAIYAFLEDAER